MPLASPDLRALGPSVPSACPRARGPGSSLDWPVLARPALQSLPLLASDLFRLFNSNVAIKGNSDLRESREVERGGLLPGQSPASASQVPCLGSI